MKKRILSLLLCAAMMVSMVVFSGAASEEDAPELTAAETLAAEETEAPVATPESTETAEPTATPESTETAEPTDTPAPTETAEPTDTPAPTADPETGEEEINRWGTFTDEAFALYQELGGTPLYFGSLPESIFVLSSCMVGETLWYKFSTEDWEGWTYDTAYCYVEAEYVTLEEEPEVTPTPAPTTTPEAGTVTTLENKEHGVTVSGENIPEGVTLSVTDVSDSYADSAMALDIKLMNGEAEWQPSSAGTYVAVTLDVSGKGWEDGTIVTLTHIHGDTSTDYLYVVIDQKLTFYTDSFSIYIVNSTTATTGKSVAATSTQTMTVGEEKIFYWAKDTTEHGDVLGIVWSVSDSNNSVTYNVYANGNGNGYQVGSNYWTWKAPWITVNAQRATATKSVVVTATIYYSDGETASESFKITVQNATGKFHIEDKIAETGCLVPVWPNGMDTAGYTYTWTRNDGQTVKTDALHEDGTVNVSIDRGGVTNDREPITYTVTATKDGEETKTATFQVIYGQEILNPSFETPDLSNINNTSYDHLAIYNGYEGLYWKTTAPGTGAYLGQDVEIWTSGFGQSTASLIAANGKQFAELNAEDAGTLYQDILTTSGADLNWSFSHAGRDGGTNTMYIIISATANAQNIVNRDDITKLISFIPKNANIPESGNGYSLTVNKTDNDAKYNGTYLIWKHISNTTDSPRWTNLSGTYKVPKGQYLTRLFFASEPDNTTNTTSKKDTLGNFIDGVDAGEKMSYRIEYYPNGSLASDKTESSNGTVYTTVDLENLSDYLTAGYVITSVKVNDRDYSGDISKGLYITDYGTVEKQDVNILVKITLRQKAITVTKKVTIDGWEDLTDTQRTELVSGYEATFKLYNSSGNEVDSTTLTVSGVANDGTVTVMGEFTKASTLSDETYTIKETSYGTLTGYELESTTYTYKVEDNETTTTDVASVTISKKAPTAAVTVTNHYKIAYADLTITKTGADTKLDPDQTFIFNITGPDHYSTKVVIQGNGSVTIIGLKVGAEYTVTEDTSWSWRYEPENNTTSQAVTITADSTKNTVVFNNERKETKWLDGNAVAVNTYENTTG